MSPSRFTEIEMFSGLVWRTWFRSLGNSSGTRWITTGIVIRKMISNTSITSTSGVVLIDATSSSSPPSPGPTVIATSCSYRLPVSVIALPEAPSRTMCRSAPNVRTLSIATLLRRTSQLYPSTAGTATTRPMAVMIKASPTGPATLSIEPCPDTPIAMSALNADDGTEQSDERCRCTHGCKHGQAGLQTADDGIGSALQRLGNPLAGADRARKPRLVDLVILVRLFAG